MQFLFCFMNQIKVSFENGIYLRAVYLRSVISVLQYPSSNSGWNQPEILIAIKRVQNIPVLYNTYV